MVSSLRERLDDADVIHEQPPTAGQREASRLRAAVARFLVARGAPPRSGPVALGGRAACVASLSWRPWTQRRRHGRARTRRARFRTRARRRSAATANAFDHHLAEFFSRKERIQKSTPQSVWFRCFITVVIEAVALKQNAMPGCKRFVDERRFDIGRFPHAPQQRSYSLSLHC